MKWVYTKFPLGIDERCPRPSVSCDFNLCRSMITTLGGRPADHDKRARLSLVIDLHKDRIMLQT